MELAGITTNPVGATPVTKRFSDLGNEDFFALLIAELRSQDPLKPADNQQLFTQLSQIRQIEQSTNLNDTLAALAGEQRFAATSGLIGHYVLGELTNEAGAIEDVEGLVIGVRFESDGTAILQLHNGRSLPAEKVREVTLVENLPPDILEQLEAELAELNAGGDGENPDVPPDEANAARQRTPDPKTAGGDLFRQFGKGVDATAQILGSIFSPGVSAGI